ncbi:MAG TPA: YihY/virulence factor BrkB family protein [Acidimicrobiia bacterium]|jgi:membrane protein|nr:YihY/virulence factor BrkB family protein [Acidimicrobiia bacterium]
MLQRLKRGAKGTYEVLRTAAREYGRDRVNRMAAAVSYRALFAMAPLLLLTVYVVGLAVGGSEAAQITILDAIERLVGPEAEQAVGRFLDQLTDVGAVTGIVGLVLLLWTASTLFLELQNDLNDIFGVPYEEGLGLLKTIRSRGLGFLWALGLGLVLVVVLLLNNLWQFLGGLFPASFQSAHELIAYLTPLVSVVVLPVVIAVFMQTLTMVKVAWRAIWWGSLFTAIAVLIASYGASLYFRFGGGTSAAGIAGSIFVILLLVYVFSSVFLFGAEVTRAYEERLTSMSRPRAADTAAVSGLVAQPQPPLPTSTLVGFLAGLFVGWRRGR